MRFFLMIILLAASIAGCTTMDRSTLISPSDSLYHDANKHFEKKNFDRAIGLYEKFLEIKPRSDLAVPAKLNLGMAHFYSGNYPQAHTLLKGLDVSDENIRAYVDNVLKICEAEAGNAIQSQKEAKIAAATEKVQSGQIKVKILDAYLDNFSNVVLTGRTNRILTVIIDNKEVPLGGNNQFTATVSSWRKGRSITVTAKDESGESYTFDYFPDGESPDEPRGLRVRNTSSNSAEIEWDENDERDMKGYRIFYGLKGGSTREVPGIVTRTNHEIVGLQSLVEGANKTFQFFVRAVDKMDNESSDSDVLEVTLP